MKKFLIPVLLTLLLLAGCSAKKEIQTVMVETAIDLSGCEVLTGIDTHGGFFGDGITAVIFDCKENYDDVESQVVSKGWKETPVDENISNVLYGIKFSDNKETNVVGRDLASVKNGYWCFIDRHSQSTDKSDPSHIKRASYNFTVAVLDKDNGRFYYFEMDT